MTAIGIILFAKVMVQATLFTEYLNEHDSKEEKPNSDSLPSTQPQGEAYKINERSRQHGIAIQTIGSICHQVLCPWCHLMAKSIHRVAFSTKLHIYDGPDAQ